MILEASIATCNIWSSCSLNLPIDDYTSEASDEQYAAYPAFQFIKK